MRIHVAIILLVCLMAAPLVQASWSGRGQTEPDTMLDRTGGWMWANPDVTPGTAIGHKVYFNAFTIQNTAYVTHGVSDNENFALVGSEHPSWPGNVAALLGVWTDCNKDGYIGLGDNALFEYRADLLLDTSVCPKQNEAAVGSGAASHNHVTVHNDGTWVTEFIALGPDNAKDTAPDANPYDLNDNDARVWADWGRPGEQPTTSKCYLGFVPQGTFGSTGGLLRTVDCFNGYSATATYDSVADGNAVTRPYSFSDAPTNQSNSHSRANVQNPWGRPGSASAVDAWDCSSAPLVAPNPTGTLHQVSAPRVPPTLNTAGTAAGTTEATVDGLIDCNAADDVSGNQYSYQAANLPYSQEKQGVFDVSDSKKESDFPMAYNEGTRPAPTGSLLGKRDSLDQGARVESSDGQWISDARLAEDKNPFVSRADLAHPTANPIQPVEYLTAYAYVSPAAISQYSLQVNPSGNKVGTYGFENCGANTSGVHNGWDCDASEWACTGAYGCTAPVNGVQVDVSVHVGQAYDLRDVDCYDNSVTTARSAGVGWGVLTGTSCV